MYDVKLLLEVVIVSIVCTFQFCLFLFGCLFCTFLCAYTCGGCDVLGGGWGTLATLPDRYAMLSGLSANREGTVRETANTARSTYKVVCVCL